METATQRLHRLTSYEPGRDWDLPLADPWVIQDLEANDLSRLPWPFGGVVRVDRLALPRDLPATSAPAVAVLAGTADVGRGTELDLAQLSRLLHLSAGVVRTMAPPSGVVPFRAAGSAGGRFPLEAYVAIPEGSALPAGVHWYDPEAHALVRVGPPPLGVCPGSWS